MLQTTDVGSQPVKAAFQPTVGRYGLITPQANTSFTPDGATAFMTVTGTDAVVAIDMAALAVVARIPTGSQPMGLALVDTTASRQL
ncbi:MAG: hypothetical protein JO023_18425 [Chloroflexi bacterium]|nr:hypothetical protein [Chloroflexota bacterium]